MIAAFASLLVMSAFPSAKLVANAESHSWHPMEMQDIAAITQSAVAEEITATGLLRLQEKASDVDALIRIDTRIIEEAEDASTVITFIPTSDKQLPSISTSEVIHLGGRDKPGMARALRDSARQAAKRFITALGPHLLAHKQRTKYGAAIDATEAFWWRFADVELGKRPLIRGKGLTLADPTRPRHERSDALAELSPLIPEDAAIRSLVQRCALGDPQPLLRLDCVRALTVTARTHTPTQQILLQVLRDEWDPAVRLEVLDQSAAFAGMARAEAIQTWLYVISDGDFDTRVHDKAANLIDREGAVPNLEHAVARCLARPSVDAAVRKVDCVLLARNLPTARRWAALETYLRATPPLLVQRYEYRPWQRAANSLLEKDGRRTILPDRLRDLLVQRLAPPNPAHIRVYALHLLKARSPHDENYLRWMVAALRAPASDRHAIIAIGGLSYLGKEVPDLVPAIRLALDELDQAGNLVPTSYKYRGRLSRLKKELTPKPTPKQRSYRRKRKRRRR